MLPEEEFPEEEVANVAGAAEVLIMTPLARLGLFVRSWEDVDGFGIKNRDVSGRTDGIDMADGCCCCW